MGFTTDNSMIRVDFFKDSGKWYSTESIRWRNQAVAIQAFEESLRHGLVTHPDGRLQYSGMWAIALESCDGPVPFPLMCRVPEQGIKP